MADAAAVTSWQPVLTCSHLLPAKLKNYEDMNAVDFYKALNDFKKQYRTHVDRVVSQANMACKVAHWLQDKDRMLNTAGGVPEVNEVYSKLRIAQVRGVRDTLLAMCDMMARELEADWKQLDSLNMMARELEAAEEEQLKAQAESIAAAKAGAAEPEAAKDMPEAPSAAGAGAEAAKGVAQVASAAAAEAEAARAEHQAEAKSPDAKRRRSAVIDVTDSAWCTISMAPSRPGKVGSLVGKEHAPTGTGTEREAHYPTAYAMKGKQ